MNESDEHVPGRWTASTVYADMWIDPAEDPRETSAELVDERSTLVEYLRAYRLTLQMKCADLDVTQMADRSVAPSTMSLLGLVRHITETERHWFRRVMGGEEAPKLYCSDVDPDGDWNGAVADSNVVNAAWKNWRDEVEYAERLVNGTSDLARTGQTKDARTLQLREVLVHMIEEYARHCGQADLLRERIDGRVGQ